MKHHITLLIALMAILMLTLNACAKEELEGVQVFHYEVSCSNSDLKSEYNAVLKQHISGDNTYTDTDLDAPIKADCDALYASHAKIEKYQTMASCTVTVKRRYVSALEGAGTVTLATYAYPIK